MASVNQRETVRVPRLSEVLFDKADRSFGSIAALPSNIEAIDAALLFSAGLSTFGVLVGPSGWGKTHLLEAVSYRFRHETGAPCDVIPAARFIAQGHLGTTTGPLILDDCQEVLGKTRSRMALRLALERRMRPGRPTLLAFTLPKATRQLRNFLPSPREWTIATIQSPEPAERVLLINQMTVAEGLALSPSLVKILATHMLGNGCTLAGALKRLRLSGPSWLDARSTLKACGLLDPFFSDNPAWDLRLKIMKRADACRAQFSRVAPMDLAVYTMLREASLSEAGIAQMLGVEPADVYLRASRFAKDIERDPMLAAYVTQFIEIVVAALGGQ